MSGPAQGLARAFGKAVSNAAPLVAEQPALHRKAASLPELLDSLAPEAFVTLLGGDAGPPGLALIDQEGFATLVEAMTIGRLGISAPAPRRPTVTDAALLSEVLDAALSDLGAEDPVGTLRCTRAVPDHRLLPVLMDEVEYDLVVLTAVLLGGTISRPLRVMLALPRPVAEADLPVDGDGSPARPWAEALEDAVSRAPTCLRAELGRVNLTLGDVMALVPGSALTLPLSNLEEVRLASLDGATQAIGRLGQTRGMRAIRLTGWPGGMPAATMVDAMPPSGVSPQGMTGAWQGAPPGLGSGRDADEEGSGAAPLGEEDAESEGMEFPTLAPMSLDLDEGG